MAGIMAHVSLPKFHAESEFNLCVMKFTLKIKILLWKFETKSKIQG